MLNISEIVQSAQGGAVIENLARQFGLSPEQTKSAANALIPALSFALQHAASSPEGLGAIIKTATVSDYGGAFAKAEAAHSASNVELGTAALAHFFGSPAASGQVAQVAAGASGLRPDIVSQLLPVLASVVLGGLFKSFKDQGAGQILGQLGGGGMGQLLEQLISGAGSRQQAPSVSGGLGQILEQLVRGGGSVAPSTEPSPPLAPSGGLGGLLGGLLGSVLGGGAAKESTSAPAGSGAPAATGFDLQSLEAALDQIRKTLQPGAVQSNPAHETSLQDILGQALGIGRK